MAGNLTSLLVPSSSHSVVETALGGLQRPESNPVLSRTTPRRASQ
jgi:hypothetical protein